MVVVDGRLTVHSLKSVRKVGNTDRLGWNDERSAKIYSIHSLLAEEEA